MTLARLLLLVIPLAIFSPVIDRRVLPPRPDVDAALGYVATGDGAVAPRSPIFPHAVD